ncbi:MAG: serine hydrolase domain-containing protein [Pseudoxanthomonas sp.]
MKTATLHKLALATALSIVATACSAPAPRGDIDAAPSSVAVDDVQAKAAAFEQVMQQHAIPGAQLGWWHGGVFREFDHGVLRKDEPAAVAPQTVFEAASLSKVVGAYIALRLVDAGKLDLDTPLWDYWHSPRTKDNPQARKITARMVLNHTTGLVNWQVDPTDPKLDAAPLESVFAPGQRYAYSGEGFYLLQKTLEHISGLDWNALAQREVFVPLDMPSSRYITDKAFDAVNSTGHRQDGTPRRPRVFPTANTAWTLTSNVHDYGSFIQRGLFKGEGLKPGTRALMLAESSNADDKYAPSAADPFVSWGLGVGLQTTAAGKRAWHWGDNPGFKAFFMLDPDNGDSIILFTNSENGPATYKQVLELFLGAGDYPAVDWVQSQS